MHVVCDPITRSRGAVRRQSFVGSRAGQRKMNRALVLVEIKSRSGQPLLRTRANDVVVLFAQQLFRSGDVPAGSFAVAATCRG